MENNRREYIERLQVVIHQLHGVDSTWRETEYVHKMFQGATVWESDVEVFGLKRNHAGTAYARSDAEGNFTAVLGVPPATDPKNAVKVSIVAAAKKGKKVIRLLFFVTLLGFAVGCSSLTSNSIGSGYFPVGTSECPAHGKSLTKMTIVARHCPPGGEAYCTSSEVMRCKKCEIALDKKRTPLRKGKEPKPVTLLPRASN